MIVLLLSITYNTSNTSFKAIFRSVETRNLFPAIGNKDPRSFKCKIHIMKLSQFRYNLPQELIALYPSENRDESRLLVVNRETGEIEHRICLLYTSDAADEEDSVDL